MSCCDFVQNMIIHGPLVVSPNLCAFKWSGSFHQGLRVGRRLYCCCAPSTSASSQAEGGRKETGHGDKKKTAATVVRPTVLRLQTRLYGKPESSFFAKSRARVTGVPAKTVANSGPAPSPSSDPSPSTESGSENTSIVCPSSGPSTVIEVAAVHPPGGTASNVRSVTSSLDKDGDIIGGGSTACDDALSVSFGFSGATLGDIRPRKPLCGVKPRREISTAPAAGASRTEGAQGVDYPGHAPAASCSLHGELVLLDGVLHDPRVKAWVEKSLGPPTSKKRPY